ncbi:hypothetical protein FRB91_002987 [Serendipita sp. 411]|nr:hypothetical protein FRB91_002987 [Serendipita sp. 411]KAG8848846.1 hypothetical protein FRC20_002432 [Serendipita sp. 405]
MLPSTSTSSSNRQRMNREDRARWAKQTINQTIPAILRGDALSRAGIKHTILHRNLPPMPSPNPIDDASISIHIWQVDTLSAAQALHGRTSSPPGRLAILNMASYLRPGGGVLTGAQSQEEFLCTRTTLYPALRDEFYRLPEVSVVFTRDVVVFRDANGEDFPKQNRFHVDVATSAMLRADLTEVEGATTWADDQVKEVILAKMRLLMRVLCGNGVKRVVLGAWGCGAYGNPVEEMARLWRIVLLGGKKGKKEHWKGLEEVIFAITDQTQMGIFRRIFEDTVSPSLTPF